MLRWVRGGSLLFAVNPFKINRHIIWQAYSTLSAAIDINKKHLTIWKYYKRKSETSIFCKTIWKKQELKGRVGTYLSN